MWLARDWRVAAAAATVAALLPLESCLFDENGEDCICTANFAMVTFNVVTSTGTPQADIDIEVTNIRTGNVLSVEQPHAHEGVYVVINDSYRRAIPETGEHLQVVGTRGANQFTEMFTAGVDQPCRCHVHKLSGPGTITVDWPAP